MIATVAGLVTFLAGALLARRPDVTRMERRWFGAINRVTPTLFVPAWLVMQLGSLAAVLATAGALTRSGRGRIARWVALRGTAAWAAAKLVKPCVRRDRPGRALGSARVLGRAQTGLGYPSGHAAVAATLAWVTVPHLPRRSRAAAWAVALLVGPTRVYVGAHLPLDILGGIGLGLAVGSIGPQEEAPATSN